MKKARQTQRTDRRYRKFRKQQLVENPLCVRCKAKGITSPTQELHHKIPVHQRPDLIMDRDNVECLCLDCHQEAERDRNSRFIPCDLEGNPLR